jgi:nitrogen fixation/metabolism regulation signal transduction histidine kinase
MEPYYTTRETGSGLGLAIVYKIINDHGGKVVIGQSNLLGGAKIFMEIPCIYSSINEENYGF